jgi:hypothetical protein
MATNAFCEQLTHASALLICIKHAGTHNLAAKHDMYSLAGTLLQDKSLVIMQQNTLSRISSKNMHPMLTHDP